MKMTKKITLLGTLMAGLMAANLYAALPETMNFQGRLFDSAGEPVTSAKSIVFQVYDAATNGNSLHSETKSVTPDEVGIYNVILGKTTPFTGVSFDQPLFVQVTVDGEVLTPRYEVTAAPYSLRSKAADTVDWSGITNVPSGFTLDPSSVTLQGNTFNTANTLLQLNSSGKIPPNIGSTANIRTTTINTTLTATDEVLLVNATAGVTTITLPSAVGIAGRIYIIKKVAVTLNVINLSAPGGQTVDGILNFTLLGSLVNIEGVTVISDGTNWFTL